MCVGLNACRVCVCDTRVIINYHNRGGDWDSVLMKMNNNQEKETYIIIWKLLENTAADDYCSFTMWHTHTHIHTFITTPHFFDWSIRCYRWYIVWQQ